MVLLSAKPPPSTSSTSAMPLLMRTHSAADTAVSGMTTSFRSGWSSARTILILGSLAAPRVARLARHRGERLGARRRPAFVDLALS